MTVSQNWCSLFPEECPFLLDPWEFDRCETKAAGNIACTLDRVGAPRPVANGVVTRSGAGGEREFLLVRRRAGISTQPGCWALPGGGLRANESVEAAALREVLEETGWRVRVRRATVVAEGAVQLLHATHPFVVAPGTDSWDEPGAYVGFFCECAPTQGEPTQAPSDPNITEARWLPEREVTDLIARGQVTPLDSAVLWHHFGVPPSPGGGDASWP